MKTWKILAAAAGILCFAGCQNSVNSVENADKNAAPSIVADKRYVTDGFLKDRLLLRSVKMGPAATGCMTAEVTAVNARTGAMSQFWSWFTGENPYSVDYRFTWQDGKGISVESPLTPSWRRVTIHPGETVFFNSTSPSPDCRDFVLQVKESE